ncbi:fructosamine kinase [Stemphylium lycopersici]|uniref:protein-ribulosamine 3-kinase n=1 Tax=Stemphylium lycopersici TaxID=183478 RepID=A0A364NAV8_STELY|nr:fructosamine kinase [Stemphylium lycopersici]RAR14370.1 fructosamine kinase [Stemphylium lycopersici]
MSNPFELAPDADAGFSASIDVDDAVAPGSNGRSMLEGEYHSAVDMREVLPGFSPIPIGWGVFDSDADLAFFLQAFHDMDTEIPDMDLLTRTLAEFHIKSSERFEELTRDRERPAGMKFGYHVTTHNGKLAQDNTWTSTWEEYFVRNMKRMLEHDEKEGGERPQEIKELLPPLFDKVIPRLLRPMEMDGREVKPSLIHGDLWYGNTSTDHENNAPIVRDTGSENPSKELIYNTSLRHTPSRTLRQETPYTICTHHEPCTPI